MDGATVIPIIPIEASADGKRNAFTHACSVLGHYKNYAVCLHLINERKQGRLDIIYSDCSAAIGKKRCPALAMHKEEKEAGRAIYFKERIRTLGNAFTNAAAALLKARNGRREEDLPKPEVVDKSSVIEKIADFSYADAINSKIASGEHVEPEVKPDTAKTRERKPKVEPVAVKATTPKIAVTGTAEKGESLLEMAKRLMNKEGV